MGSNRVIQKLERFITKYYINELIKGGILFLSVGLLYFLFTVGLEWVFWLGKTGRLFLFWLFIAVELTLFIRFIGFPILKLFKLKKGIDYEQAAHIIGKHFKNVDDKLVNFIQLQNQSETKSSDFLIADIEKRTQELSPVPFKIAVNFKDNFKYFKYAVLPITILLVIWFFGKIPLLEQSYSRVVNYQTAYEPPAPFHFVVLNDSLQAKENEPFVLRVNTEGKVKPDQISIQIDGSDYVLKEENGIFLYTFKGLKKNTAFRLKANKMESPLYELAILNTPKIARYKMSLVYPDYLKRKNDGILGSGNIEIPEGTTVKWQIQTEHTDQMVFAVKDTSYGFTQENQTFYFTNKFIQNTDYQIYTYNNRFPKFEELAYRIKVIKDAYPEIKVLMKEDTVRQEQLYFKGSVSDDYGLRQLTMVYYPVDDYEARKSVDIPIQKSNFDEFYTRFPGDEKLEPGAYEVFFRVGDNDGVNGSKFTQSDVFSYKVLNDSEKTNRQLENQKQNLNQLTESLEEMKSSSDNFSELEQLQKENAKLDYNDRLKVEDFLQNVKDNNAHLENNMEKMRNELSRFESDKNDDQKKALQERLEENENRLKENEKLWEDLQKYQQKINDAHWSEKMQKVAHNQKSQQRSLEELLELTKRYYVEKKQEHLANELMKLSDRLNQLSQKDSDNTTAEQNSVNKKFESLLDQIENLEEENNNLQKPFDLGRDQDLEKSVEEDLEEALENLEDLEEMDKDEDSSNAQQQQMKLNKAQSSQNSGSQKMQEMAEAMQSQMNSGNMEQLSEDIESLKRTLKNLLQFSFEQEDLLLDFKSMPRNSPELGAKLQLQNTLRENFKHVDDSLHALALRNPQISNRITEQLSDIQFDLNSALELLAKFTIGKGTSHQQGALTGANNLANLLDDALQNMEAQMQSMGQGQGEGMPNPGSGEGKEFQLSDIIQGQQDLEDQLEQEMNGSGKGSEGEGENSGDSGSDGEGSDGESGANGQNSEGNEGSSERLFEIYKEQEKLRMQLEDLMQNENDPALNQIREGMEKMEDHLLNNGLTRSSLNLMKALSDRMLKLKNASYQNSTKEGRASRTNRKEYQNEVRDTTDFIKDYFQTIEILNRQSLPLQNQYLKLVKDYFKDDD